MKKAFMAIIISMIISTNVFAKDSKPTETLKKNELCILTQKAVYRSYYVQTDHYGNLEGALGKWITDVKVAAEYYRYIVKDNKLGLGLGFNTNPMPQIYDIYSVAKISATK